jgi:hypothetical protein
MLLLLLLAPELLRLQRQRAAAWASWLSDVVKASGQR